LIKNYKIEKDKTVTNKHNTFTSDDKLMPMVLGTEIIKSYDDCDLVDPYEFTYWVDRSKRIFYIDYEIETKYKELLELSKIIMQMNILEKDTPVDELEPIKIFVHTYGGDLEQTLYFCDLIKSSRIPIYTIAMGVAMSAGFYIYLAGHKRFVFPHTRVMVHTGSATFSGTSQQVKTAQQDYERQLDEIKNYVLENTSISTKTFNKNKDTDWYLSADDMAKYNMVDEIITDVSSLF